MRKKDLVIAQEFKRRLSSIVQLVDFRVFGSRARGEAGRYSDFDVFIEVESLTPEQKEQVGDLAWEVGFHHHLVLAPVVFTRDEIENTPVRASPLVEVVREEGICV